MEKSTPLKYFMELSSFDQSLNGIRYNIASLTSQCKSLSEELLQLSANIDTNREELNRIQKSVHQHELIMKELDLNLQKQKDLLETVTNQKEYNAVKNAIHSIKQEQHDYENILIDEWNKLDQSKTLFETKQLSINKEILKVKSDLAEKQLALQQLEQELSTQSQQRLQFLKHLPSEWLEKYDAMYTKVNNPIVQLLNNVCGACYQDATAQVIVELKNHKLTQCKGCFRFLFF